jgi:hypothetical protein
MVDTFLELRFFVALPNAFIPFASVPRFDVLIRLNALDNVFSFPHKTSMELLALVASADI